MAIANTYQRTLFFFFFPLQNIPLSHARVYTHLKRKFLLNFLNNITQFSLTTQETRHARTFIWHDLIVELSFVSTDKHSRFLFLRQLRQLLATEIYTEIERQV